ncbi:MAG: PAS domain S-box protein [Magnetococcales bacterium]|nr:PAS domain S-box protein [Magnetococcales bacterium]
MKATTQTILLIEDNPADARLIRERLKGTSYDHHVASRLSEGLDYLTHHSVIAILLDLSLPDSQGLDTVSQVLTHSPEIPVVVLTGLDNETLGDSAVAQGAQDYIVKGELTAQLLKRTLRYAIERKRTEAVLRESEERFRNISASANDAIILVDSSGVIVFWNQAACKLFEFAEADALGHPLSIIIPTRYQAAHDAGLQRFVASGSGPMIGHTMEMIGKKGDGREFPIEVSLSAVRHRDQWQAMAIARDLTERKYSESLLLLSEKMSSISQMAAGIAHEVNHPLTTASLNIETLKLHLENSMEDQEVINRIENVERNLERAATLARELLVFARSDKTEFSSLDINEEIEVALTLLGPRLDNITVKQQTTDDMPMVMGNSVKAGQLFGNLFNNAIDAMSGRGTLFINSSYQGDRIVVDIRDTGPGIPADHQDKLFDPFFSTKSPGSGTGLGLSICYDIIKRHRGGIRFIDTEQEGATVRIWFPVVWKKA